MWTVALDLIVALLLVATIGYAIRLDRRLRTVRRERADLERVATNFEAAIGRAEEGLSAIKATAEQVQGGREEAKRLHDDLNFLIERADGLADRLEHAVRSARDVAKQSRVDPLEDHHGPRSAQFTGRAGRGAGAGRSAARSRVGDPSTDEPDHRWRPQMDQPAPPSSTGIGASRPLAAALMSKMAATGRETPPTSDSERELLAALAARR